MSKFDLHHSLEILKAAFPYLDSRSKNTLELFIKFGDLFSILSRKRYKDDVSAYSFSDDDKDKREKTDVVGMLKNVKKVCYDDEIKIIDNILNLVNTFELFETYQDLFSMMSPEGDLGGLGNMLGMGNISSNPADMMEMLGTMLATEDNDVMNNVNSILHMMNSSSDNSFENIDETEPNADYSYDSTYMSEYMSEHDVQNNSYDEDSDEPLEYYDDKPIDTSNDEDD